MSATDTALQAPGSQLYKELQDDEIRFVILRPSLFFAAPIQLSLRTTCFSNKPVYTALSYVWGDQNVTSTIYIDGIPEQATTNLVSALRHIRHPCLAQILWIDAICINQKHTKERNHQVQLMATIYKNASEVIAWLGESYDNSDEAMALMKRWSSALVSVGAISSDLWSSLVDKLQNTDFAESFFSTIDNPFPIVAWSSLRSFLDRSYWRRLWIIQEFVLAKRLLIQCGSKKEDWTILNMPVFWLSWYLSMPFSRALPRQLVHTIEELFENETSQYIELFCWRIGWERKLPLDSYGSVPRLLWYTCSNSCSDPRDYVFGLTGLLPDTERLFDVDYSLTVNETYIGFAKSRIMRADYGVMMFSGIGLSSARHTSSDLPSWSPDWHALGKIGDIGFYLEQLYSTGHSSATPVQMPYLGAQNTVTVPGTALCSLDEILEGFSNWSHPDDTRWKNLVFHSSEGKSYFNGMPLLQAYFKTILADKDPHHGRRAEPRAVGTDEITCAACSTLCFNFLRRFCIDSCNTISEDEREGFKQKLLTERDISDTLSMGCFYREDQKPSKEDWASKIEASDEYLKSDIQWLSRNRDRSFFTTKKKYIGTGPPYARKGDLICVFHNAKMPFIIRPYKDGCQLVGAAFVLGFMDGEAFENIDESWTPKYFKIY